MAYFLLSALIVVADQAVKFWITARLALFETVTVWRFIAITYVQNTGAAFSLFRNGTFFLTLLAAGLLLVVALLWRKPYVRPYRLPLALLLGGAVGNMIDRIFRGYVVDFIQVGTFPVFNIADIFVVTGVALMALLILKSETKGGERDEKKAS